MKLSHEEAITRLQASLSEDGTAPNCTRRTAELQAAIWDAQPTVEQIDQVMALLSRYSPSVTKETAKRVAQALTVGMMVIQSDEVDRHSGHCLALATEDDNTLAVCCCTPTSTLAAALGKFAGRAILAVGSDPFLYQIWGTSQTANE
jgi:hypothetical protein